MQKYEREIEDLLQKLESEEGHVTRPPRRDRPPQLPRRRQPMRSPFTALPKVSSLSSGQWMATGLGLVVLSRLLPESLPVVRQWLAIIGVLLFLWPIAHGLLTGGRGHREEKLWRGRSIESDDNSWGEIRARMESSVRDFKRRFSRRRY